MSVTENLFLSFSAEYQLLCGNQAPGFIIDIHTGKPIGEVVAVAEQHKKNRCWYKVQFAL